jgi:hypothetical protein
VFARRAFQVPWRTLDREPIKDPAQPEQPATLIRVPGGLGEMA